MLWCIFHSSIKQNVADGDFPDDDDDDDNANYSCSPSGYNILKLIIYYLYIN